jgi:hypothetical protein
MWNMFTYVFVYPAATLLFLLLSGKKLLMDIANMCMATPIRVHGYCISIATLMTGLCACCCYISYSGMSRARSRIEANSPLGCVAGVCDKLDRDLYYQERNLNLSLLAMTLWAASFQFKNLIDNKKIIVQTRKWKKVTLSHRLVCVAILVVCFPLADIPLCRINYNFQLWTFVTPKKDALLNFGAQNSCTTAMLGAERSDQCKDFCKEARTLSVDRLWAINWARNFHITGRLAAEFFDNFRGVDQGEARIEQLFKERTCERVLQSVDKSNHLVNGFCWLLSGAAFMCCFLAMQALIDGPATQEIDLASTAPVVGVAAPSAASTSGVPPTSTMPLGEAPSNVSNIQAAAKVEKAKAMD